MTRGRRGRGAWAGGLLAALLLAPAARPAGAAADPLDELLARAGRQATAFLAELSEVKCTEHVTQEKLGASGKVLVQEQSSFDYLVLLSAASGEVSLAESRIPLKAAKQDPHKDIPLLLSNGFATLFLIFHPYYAGSFQFTPQGEEVVDGRRLAKVQFQHLRGMRTPAALALRGREYPLDLEGTAWIDPESGAVARIDAEVVGMEDVGLKTLRARVDYSPAPFADAPKGLWLPAQVRVEVETPHQHWRNLHRFSDYEEFTVHTEKKVTIP